MADIEKVKAGLKAHGESNGCDKCPYWPDDWCGHNMANDALAVIEAQERHINELHDGIVRLRDAMSEEVRK